MKKILILVVAIISGFITLAIVSGVIAATFTILAGSALELPVYITILLGVFSEIAKFGLTIFAGVKIYKYLNEKSTRHHTTQDTTENNF